MIRKPGAEDFRESTAVTAVRETRKIAVEGSRGIGNGFSRALLYWFGGMMVLGFITSLGAELGPVALLVVGGGAVFWWKQRKASEAARMEALRLTPHAYLVPAPPARNEGIGDNVPFPAEVRREGRVELDIGTVVQRTVILFGAGFVMMVLFAEGEMGIPMTLGVVLVTAAVLMVSRIFGDRTVLAWDTRTVTVQHILGKGTMQWADVVDVSVVKAPRLDLWTFCQTGSRRNIVLRAPLNRLGGPTELKVPIRLLAMDKTHLEALLRDLFCWRAAGNSVAGVAEARPAPAYERTAPASPAADPRESFDPDAIIARHLSEREQVVRLNRPDLTPASRTAAPTAASVGGGRPVFGRKVV